MTFAVCADPVPGTTTASTVVQSSGQQVSCPLGTQVIGAGGGGPLSDPGATFLRAAFPEADMRRVRADMTIAPNDGMVVQAVCAP